MYILRWYFYVIYVTVVFWIKVIDNRCFKMWWTCTYNIYNLCKAYWVLLVFVNHYYKSYTLTQVFRLKGGLSVVLFVTISA